MTPTNTPLHPNIVRAWFDTVLNPLVRALRTEAEVLKTGNLTWRFEQRKLASLVQVRDHVPPEAWDNYEQFLALYPQCKQPIDYHDGCLDELIQACTTFADRLAESQAMRETFDSAVKGLPTSSDVAAIFDPVPPNHYLEAVAEYVINDVQRLPSYYATSSLWNDHIQEFRALRDSDQVREFWVSMDGARNRFSGAINQLIALLAGLRNDLSLSAGVPIVDQLAR